MPKLVLSLLPVSLSCAWSFWVHNAPINAIASERVILNSTNLLPFTRLLDARGVGSAHYLLRGARKNASQECVRHGDFSTRIPHPCESAKARHAGAGLRTDRPRLVSPRCA